MAKKRRKGKSQQSAGQRSSKTGGQLLQAHLHRQATRVAASRWGPREAADLLRQLPTTTPAQRLEAQRRCLASGDSAAARQTLEALWRHVPEPELRRMMGQVRRADQAFVIPLLTALARERGDLSQYAILAALGRIGHPAAEPLLLEFLERPRALMARQALQALAHVGTPASLRALRALEASAREDLGVAVRHALAAISARHPQAQLAAGQGALTVVDDRARGALSALRAQGAGQGDLDLYQEAQRALDAAPSALRRPRSPREGSWSELALGPRPLPWAWTLWRLTFASPWQRELMIGAVGLSLLSALGQWPLLWGMSALATLAAMALSARSGPRMTRVLREGVPTLASHQRLDSPDSPPQAPQDEGELARGEPDRARYLFEAMDAHGRPLRVERVLERARHELTDEPLEAMVVLSREGSSEPDARASTSGAVAPRDVILEDELPLLYADARGQWAARPRWAALIALLWLGLLGGWLVLLARVLMG